MIDSQMGTLKRIESVRVRYPQYEEALNRIEKLHELWKSGAQARNLMIVGPSGAGKSTVLDTFRFKHPPTEQDEYRHIPVLYITVPSTPTLRNCAEEILIALGEPLRMRGSATEKTIQIIQLIKNCRVEILLIDEFHHFLKQKRVSMEDVSEWLKVVIDRAGIPVVLMGLPFSKEILRANQQLRRRFAATVSLEPFRLETNEDCALFRSVLHAIGSQINTATASALSEWDIVKRMYFATDGLIGYVHKLVVEATLRMVEGNSTRIEQWMLEEAFTAVVWNEGVNKLNPFNRAFIFRRLDKQYEPFETTYFSSKTRSK